jgi:hypothetical protein
VKNTFLAIIALSASLLVNGCVSHFSVTKVAPGTNPKGLRVHLPAPFVVGRPTPDGTIKYGVEYLPDPDEEYAISAWSIMAKQKTDITRTVEMYVQKMNLSQDTTAVAAQMAASAGAVGKTAVDTMVAQKQAEATAEAAAQKGRDDARKALDIAEANLKFAQEAVDDAEKAGADQATIKNLRDKVTAATQAVLIAKIGLENAKKSLSEARNMDLAGGDEAAETPKQTVRSVPGPVIYRIVENARTGGIALEPVNFKLFSLNRRSTTERIGTQLDFQTWGKKPPADTGGNSGGTQSKGPKMISPTNGEITVNKFAGVYSQIVKFDTTLKDAKEQIGPVMVKDSKEADQKKYLTSVNFFQKSVTLNWDKDTPNGKYSITLVIWFSDGGARSFPLSLTVM